MPGSLIRATRLLAQLAGDDLHAGGREQFARRVVRLGLIVCAGLLAAIALSASAAEPPRPTDPLYHVELLFLKPVTPLGVPEDWGVEAARAQPNTMADAGEEEAGQIESTERQRLAVRSLPSAQFRLAGLESSLQRSRNYELLRHVGWTQAATPRGGGLAVDIGDVANDGQPLQGNVALERGRFLYLRLNLTYTPEVPPNSLLGGTNPSAAASPAPSATPAAPTTQSVTFALKQTRRIRAFERHYFDHPAFGVIAMVSPVGSAPR